MKMENCGFSACDIDRRRSYPHSSVAPHIPLFDALDRGSHSKGRREQREFLPLRYGEASYTTTTPADLAPIPETYGFIAVDRARRRPRRIGHLTRAEFPGSTGELRPHRWSAHPSPVGDYPTSPLHRVMQNSNQGVFYTKSIFPYFDGESNDEDYLEWEQYVDDFFYYAGVPLERQVRCVVRKLIGRAKTWWTLMLQARHLEGRREVKSWRKMKNLLRSQFLTSDHKLWLDEAKLSGVTEVIETSEAEARGLRAEWDAKQTNLRTAIEKVDEEIASVTVESKCFKERLLFKEKALQRITQESDGLEVCETGSSEKAKELSESLTKMSSRKDRENDDLRRNTEFESNHALFDNGKEPNMLHKVIVVMNNNATESETGNSKAPTEEAWKVVKDEMILNAWPQEPIAKLLTLTEEERDLATLLVESIILDEAHFIKDRHCSTARAVFALHSLYKWALSGTPLRNHVGELYSLVRFIQINPYAFYLCKDYNCKVLDYGYTKDCPNCPHSTVRHFCWWNRYISKPIKESVYDRENSKRAMILLKKKVLSSILLRRTKLGRASDLSLPPRIVTLRRDSLDKKEEEFYEALYTQSLLQFGTYVEAGTLMNNYAHIFDLLTRLRQAVDHPYLVVYSSSVDVSAGDTNKSDCGICHDPTEDLVVTSCDHSFCKACLVEYSAASGDVLCPTCAKPLTVDLTTSCNSGGNTCASSTRGCKRSRILQRVDKDDFKTSTKIDALKEEIRNMIEGDGSAKGIVFSQFTSFLDLINFSLQQSGIRCVQLVGSMSLPEREKAIKMFTDDANCKIFLMSLKAGGVALNLTMASNVFLMDPWWNPAVERQAQDRIHRIGQYKPIRTVRFIIADTIEERILRLQEKKELVFEGTVGNSTEALAKLTEADLRFLFNF